MTLRKLNYREIEIPELDAFLRDYRALCGRYGIQLTAEEYGYDGGCYTTIEKFSGGEPHLNLDYADRQIPFLARAYAEVERLQREEAARENEARKRQAEARKRRADADRIAKEKQLVAEGVVLGGKKYKLVAE